MREVLFLYKKLKHKNSFFSFSYTVLAITSFVSSFLVSSIIFVLSGFRYEIKKNIFEFIGNYRFQKYDHSALSIDDVEKNFSSLSGMKKVSPYVKKNILIQCLDAVEGGVLLGLHTRDNVIVSKYLCAGRVREKGDEIVLGKKIFDSLHIDLGEYVSVIRLEGKKIFDRYKIVGVFETGIDDVDEHVIIGDIVCLQNNFDGKSIFCDGVNFFFEGDYKELRNRAKNCEGRLRKVEDDYGYVGDWLKILEKNLGLYIFIILLAVFTNIICVFMLQIFEKRGVINLLLQIGMLGRDIKRIFVLRNMEYVLKYMFCGLLFSLVCGYLQWRFQLVRLDAEDYYLNFVPVRFDFGLLFVWGICLVVSLYFVLSFSFLFIKKK